jgi:dTMP kinase
MVPSSSVADPAVTEKEMGPFIVIEGIDGAGTTTQGDRITAHLQKTHKVFFTNEPSNGPAGMLIRLALARRLLGPNHEFHDPQESMDGAGAALDPYTMAFLFAADRADHLATVVEPNLRRGRIVICDRYLLSTFAYQGLELPLSWLVEVNRHFRRPDLTIYLDVPADQARFRMRSARWAKDLYEDDWHLQQVRERYLELINMGLPQLGPIVRLDGTAQRSQITRRILEVLDEFLSSGRVSTAQGELSLF